MPSNPAQLFLKATSMLSATSTTRDQLVHCLDVVAAGGGTPIVAQGLPLAAAAEAHRRVEAGAVAGRIVLQPQH